jgi:hypothetical protein
MVNHSHGCSTAAKVYKVQRCFEESRDANPSTLEEENGTAAAAAQGK